MFFWIDAAALVEEPGDAPEGELLEDEEHDEEREQRPEAEPEVGLDQSAVVFLLRLGEEGQVLQEPEHRVRR